MAHSHVLHLDYGTTYLSVSEVRLLLMFLKRKSRRGFKDARFYILFSGSIFNVIVFRIILDQNFNSVVEVFYTPKYSFIVLN